MVPVVATVTKGGRIRLPEMVKDWLKIEDGEQVVFYVGKDQSFAVVVPAQEAINEPPVTFNPPPKGPGH